MWWRDAPRCESTLYTAPDTRYGAGIPELTYGIIKYNARSLIPRIGYASRLPTAFIQGVYGSVVYTYMIYGSQSRTLHYLDLLLTDVAANISSSAKMIRNKTKQGSKAVQQVSIMRASQSEAARVDRRRNGRILHP